MHIRKKVRKVAPDLTLRKEAAEAEVVERGIFMSLLFIKSGESLLIIKSNEGFHLFTITRKKIYLRLNFKYKMSKKNYPKHQPNLLKKLTFIFQIQSSFKKALIGTLIMLPPNLQ